MKISFNKKAKSEKTQKAHFQALDKTQLAKVIGGADTERQTQGATFGEKIQSGLQAGASA